MSEDTAILEAERRRSQAMLGNDPAALDAILDERLAFHHANGAIDNKASYLKNLAAGHIQYIAIEWSEAQVTMLSSESAFLAGKMSTHVSVRGIEKHLDNRVLTVWARTDGAWRMAAFQSTPVVKV